MTTKKKKNSKSHARSREANAAAGESDAGESVSGASERQSRRRFAKSVAAAIVAAPLAAARAQTPAAPREPKAPPNPQPTPTPTPRAQTPPPSPVAKAYAEVARARFGSQVTDEEFKRIERDLEGNVRTADRLRASKLENWDEPDFTFEA